jgi:hypothetical protein
MAEDETPSKRKGGVAWQVLDLHSLPPETKGLYEEMRDAYDQGEEQKYTIAQEKFYAAVRGAIPADPGKRVLVVFRPARVDVAMAEEKTETKIKKGTFKLTAPEAPHKKQLKPS